jgi:hypothetical protein
LQRVPSELEAQILFGKQEQRTEITYRNSEQEIFANEQGVIFADQVEGNLDSIKKERAAIWQQRPIGSGKVYAYIKAGLLQNGMIGNQLPEHYLSVCYMATWLIERGISCQVNHYGDCDLVAEFPGGLVGFEWQTAGNNDVKLLMKKRENCENKSRRLIFTGTIEACKEIKNALNDDKIVIPRGKPLEQLLNSLIEEKLN